MKLGLLATAAVVSAEYAVHVGDCDRCAFSSLQAARQEVHRARKERIAGGQSVVPAHIVVHEGVYPPLILDAPTLDSYLTISGFNSNGEATTVVSAGTPIPKAAWSPASGSFPSGVLVANLSALGLSPGGMFPAQGTTCCDGCDQETQLTAQLFHTLPDVVSQPIVARYPNAGKKERNTLRPPSSECENLLSCLHVANV